MHLKKFRSLFERGALPREFHAVRSPMLTSAVLRFHSALPGTVREIYGDDPPGGVITEPVTVEDERGAICLWKASAREPNSLTQLHGFMRVRVEPGRPTIGVDEPRLIQSAPHDMAMHLDFGLCREIRYTGSESGQATGAIIPISAYRLHAESGHIEWSWQDPSHINRMMCNTPGWSPLNANQTASYPSERVALVLEQLVGTFERIAVLRSRRS